MLVLQSNVARVTISSAIPFSPTSASSPLDHVLLHRVGVFLLSLCNQPLHNCLPHHVVDTLRLAKLLPVLSVQLEKSLDDQ